MDVIAPCNEKVEALTESLTHGSIFFLFFIFFFGLFLLLLLFLFLFFIPSRNKHGDSCL